MYKCTTNIFTHTHTFFFFHFHGWDTICKCIHSWPLGNICLMYYISQTNTSVTAGLLLCPFPWNICHFYLLLTLTDGVRQSVFECVLSLAVHYSRNSVVVVFLQICWLQEWGLHFCWDKGFGPVKSYHSLLWECICVFVHAVAQHIKRNSALCLQRLLTVGKWWYFHLVLPSHGRWSSQIWAHMHSQKHTHARLQWNKSTLVLWSMFSIFRLRKISGTQKHTDTQWPECAVTESSTFSHFK